MIFFLIIIYFYYIQCQIKDNQKETNALKFRERNKFISF